MRYLFIGGSFNGQYIDILDDPRQLIFNDTKETYIKRLISIDGYSKHVYVITKMGDIHTMNYLLKVFHEKTIADRCDISNAATNKKTTSPKQ